MNQDIKVFLLIIFCLSNKVIFSQVISYEDSLKIENYCAEALEVFSKDFNKAIGLCEKAFELSRLDSIMMLKPLTSKALVYFQKGNKKESLEIMFDVIKIAKNSNNLAGLSSAYRNLGQIEYYTGGYEKALASYVKANTIYKEYGEFSSHPELLIDIADLHFTLQNISKAKNTYYEALEVAYEWSDDMVAEVKVRLAKILVKQNKLDSARILAEEAQAYYEKIGNHKVYNSPKDIIAVIYEKLGQYDKTIKILEERKMFFLGRGDERSYAGVALRLGILYGKKNQNNKALNSFMDSYRINKKIKNPALIDDLNMLSYFHERDGNIQKALDYYKEYMEKYKEMLNEKKLQQVNDMQVKYETEKKERENEKLSYELSISEKDAEIALQNASKKNYLIIGISILLILFLVIGVLFWKRRRVIFSYKMLRLEQNLLKTQMNPHFISNALMSAQGYIYENKMKEASDYLTKVAKLTRQVLESSRKDSVTLEEEIEILKSYIHVQQKRYNTFDFYLKVSDKLDLEEVEVAPMLTQPLVENAIEHGISNIDYRGKVEVDYSITHQNKLQILVTDNGRGIENSRSNDPEHNSISSQIIKERLKNLSDFYKQKLDFEILSHVENGTRVILTLPLKMG